MICKIESGSNWTSKLKDHYDCEVNCNETWVIPILGNIDMLSSIFSKEDFSKLKRERTVHSSSKFQIRIEEPNKLQIEPSSTVVLINLYGDDIIKVIEKMLRMNVSTSYLFTNYDPGLYGYLINRPTLSTNELALISELKSIAGCPQIFSHPSDKKEALKIIGKFKNTVRIDMILSELLINEKFGFNEIKEIRQKMA